MPWPEAELYQFLLAAAFLMAAGHVFLITRWYAALGDRFRCSESIRAFQQCGLLYVGISLLLWKLWGAFATTTVQKGWWVFRRDEIVYRNSLFGIPDGTGAIAGPLEETASCWRCSASNLCATPLRHP